MKKMMLILMACLVVVSFSAANYADAAPKGRSSYKAPSKSYTPTSPSKGSGVTKSEPSKSTTNPTTGTTTGNRGFFSGGGLMRGLMIGGLAGMMFGGMFGGLGAFGNLLGMMVNIIALMILFSVIRRIFTYFKERNSHNKKRFQE